MRQAPHIIVAASYFYPKIGGLENYAFLLAKKLHESGVYRVSIITSNFDAKGYKQETIDGMTVHRLPVWFKVSNTPINPLWYWQIQKILANDRPDLVHLHSPVPYLPDIVAAAAGSGVPIVLTYHSGSMRKGKWLIDLVIGLYETVFLRALFKRAEAVVTISQEFANRKFPEFKKKMHFIPTGVDLGRFKKTPLPMKERITFVGRLEHSSSWKGVEQLLQATVLVLKQRPHTILEIVGGGDALEHYRIRARDLGIAESVVCMGPQLDSNLVEAYERSSAVVLPSTSDAEAFSVVLVEAMASGRPIIATNVGGNPQVIEEGLNGLLVPPSDPVSLAQAIKRVLEDRVFAARLANNGALRAQSFSWDIQAKKYADLFQTLLT